MTESEVVEIIARASYERNYPPCDSTQWQQTHEDVREGFRVDARSVLSALEKAGYRLIKRVEQSGLDPSPLVNIVWDAAHG